MSEETFKQLASGAKSLNGLSLSDFTAFSTERAEHILAGTDIPLSKQAELIRLHTQARSGKKDVGQEQQHKPSDRCCWPSGATKSFQEMKLRDQIMRAIQTYGIQQPSPIQQCGILPIAEGKDVVLNAPFGSGKAVAVSIGIAQRINAESKALQCLVVCQSHEDAEHFTELMTHIGEFVADGFHTFAVSFVGRCPVDRDDDKLRNGVVVASGTPSRLVNLIRRGVMNVSNLKAIVFLNIDDLLFDFAQQTYAMTRILPRDVQFVMTSATLPTEVRDFSHWHLKEPMYISADEHPVPDGVKQFRVKVPDANEARFDQLAKILKAAGDTKAIVFCNTRWKVNWVAEKLQQMQMNPAVVHADRMREERDKDYDAFKHGDKKVLVVTEKLAAGVDTESVKLVINMDLPWNDEAYLLRVGRFGRFGHKACVINFENPGEIGRLGWYEMRFSTHIEDLPNNFMDCCK